MSDSKGRTTPSADPAWIKESDEPVSVPVPSPAPAPQKASAVAEPAHNQDSSQRISTAAFARAAVKTKAAKEQAEAIEQRAGFILRSIAFTIDALFLTGVAAIYLGGAAAAYGIADIRSAGQGDLLTGAVRLLAEAPGLGAALFVLLFLLVSGYFVYFHGSVSRTPGKALLGLRVVTDTGLPMGYSRALARWAAFVLSGLLFGLGLLWTAFSEVQQGLHDKIARTYVERQ